ncbi:MAG: 6,7-dimethyl-8-ribityllumazine synthase [Planctomycetota bacterium]
MTAIESQDDTPRIALVVSRYNESVTGALRHAAREAFLQRTGALEGLVEIDAPGSFELVAIAAAAAETGAFDGVVALGCLIHGDTWHDRYIAQGVTRGLVDLGLATGLPIGFGLLTCETADQAHQRAGGTHGNKGADAMHACLDTLQQVIALHEAAERGQMPASLPLGSTVGDKAAPGDA